MSMKENSFDLHLSGLDFTPEESISNLSQPKEPQRFDFSKLSADLKKSEVIDTLISQNEDLMNRLTLALRQSALLDEKVSDARSEAAKFKTKFASLNDQILILKEQIKVLSERLQRSQKSSESIGKSRQELEERLQIAEIRYAELYSNHQGKVEKLEALLLEIKKQLGRYRKYRSNLKPVLREIKVEKTILEERLRKSESIQQSLKQNIDETTKYITEQAKSHASQLQDLTHSYEAQLKDLNGEIEMLTVQSKNLFEQTKELERVRSEKIRIENELIVSERRREELASELRTEIEDLQSQNSSLRTENRTLALELKNKSEAYNQLDQDLNTKITENQELTNQVETLQMLWRDQQSQIEKAKNQKDALQKLNRELSVSVNNYRTEIRELKEKLEQIEMGVKSEAQL